MADELTAVGRFARAIQARLAQARRQSGKWENRYTTFTTNQPIFGTTGRVTRERAKVAITIRSTATFTADY